MQKPNISKKQTDSIASIANYQTRIKLFKIKYNN